MATRVFNNALTLLSCLQAYSLAATSPDFRIVTDIPGRDASTHYTAAVRQSTSKGGPAAWSTAFVVETICPNATEDKQNKDGRFSHLNGWSASWLSLEMGSPVEVLVQRIGKPVKRARVHPVSSGARIISIGSKGAVISIPAPARFTVDFDGGLDETDTGPSYKNKPPMHTLSIFADPLANPPDASDPAVRLVKAGDAIPETSTVPPYTTLLFGPGVHRVPRGSDGWRRYTLPPNVRVYLASGAILHTALDSGEQWGAENITLEGYGVVSGEDLERCPQPPCSENKSPQGLTLKGVTQAIVRGVTFVDFPQHHIIVQATSCKQSVLSNVKILGWRANGDGVHVFGSWLVEKLFMRTQDDSMYTHFGKGKKDGCDSTEFREITTWNDANGASFLITGNGTTLSNSDVIYARASWPWWSGGRVLSHRTGMGDTEGVQVRDIRVEDPLPSLNAIQLDSSNGYFHNILFKDISIAAPSTVKSCTSSNGCNCVPACDKAGPLPHGIPNVIGQNDAGSGIRNVKFENVTIGGANLLELAKEGGWFNVSQDGSVAKVTIDGMPFPSLQQDHLQV